MMPKAVKVRDIGTDHGGFPATRIISGSPNVTIEGMPAARVGVPLMPHAKPKHPPHPRVVKTGSKTVTINGKPAAITGGSISCGGVTIGSGTVSIGDNVVSADGNGCVGGDTSEITGADKTKNKWNIITATTDKVTIDGLFKQVGYDPGGKGLFSILLLNPIDTYMLRDTMKDAIALTNDVFPNINQLTANEAAAFMHSIWNYLMTKKIGAVEAKKLADAHQWFFDRPIEVLAMNLYNADFARVLGSIPENSAEDAKAVILSAMAQKQLRLKPFEILCYDENENNSGPYPYIAKSEWAKESIDITNLDPNTKAYDTVTLHHTGSYITAVEVEALHRGNISWPDYVARYLGEQVGFAQLYPSSLGMLFSVGVKNALGKADECSHSYSIPSSSNAA